MTNLTPLSQQEQNSQKQSSISSLEKKREKMEHHISKDSSRSPNERRSKRQRKQSATELTSKSQKDHPIKTKHIVRKKVNSKSTDDALLDKALERTWKPLREHVRRVAVSAKSRKPTHHKCCGMDLESYAYNNYIDHSANSPRKSGASGGKPAQEKHGGSGNSLSRQNSGCTQETDGSMDTMDTSPSCSTTSTVRGSK